jgi:hypothetical protein
MTTDHLRKIARMMDQLDQVSPALLREAVAECWHWIRAEMPSGRPEVTTADRLYVADLARQMASLTGAPHKKCRVAVESVTTTTRADIVIRTLATFLPRNAAEPTSIEHDPPPTPKRPAVRILADDQEADRD